MGKRKNELWTSLWNQYKVNLITEYKVKLEGINFFLNFFLLF